jgi:hypothetical protein
MYEFLVGGGGGGGQRFFRLLRAEAARLVLKLRAGARRAAQPSAMAGRINGLKGQKGEEAGMSLGVVAGRPRVVLCINSKLAIGWLLFLFIPGQKTCLIRRTAEDAGARGGACRQ